MATKEFDKALLRFIHFSLFFKLPHFTKYTKYEHFFVVVILTKILNGVIKPFQMIFRSLQTEFHAFPEYLIEYIIHFLNTLSMTKSKHCLLSGGINIAYFFQIKTISLCFQ